MQCDESSFKEALNGMNGRLEIEIVQPKSVSIIEEADQFNGANCIVICGKPIFPDFFDLLYVKIKSGSCDSVAPFVWCAGFGQFVFLINDFDGMKMLSTPNALESSKSTDSNR